MIGAASIAAVFIGVPAISLCIQAQGVSVAVLVIWQPALPPVPTGVVPK